MAGVHGGWVVAVVVAAVSGSAVVVVVLELVVAGVVDGSVVVVRVVARPRRTPLADGTATDPGIRDLAAWTAGAAPIWIAGMAMVAAADTTSAATGARQRRSDVEAAIRVGSIATHI